MSDPTPPAPPKVQTIGLAMICGDDTSGLPALFKSIEGCFDEVLVCWNGTDPAVQVELESYGARVVQMPWEDHFSKSRNASFDQSTCDLIMWLDSDDELLNANELRTTIRNAFADPEVNVLEIPYDYDFDEYGNCVMVHWISRVIRRGTFKWVGACHECLLPTQDFKKCRSENVRVLHNGGKQISVEKTSRSAERNLRIFKREYEREHTENCIDPRTILYYARSLNAMGFFKESIPVFEEYLDHSDWDDEKYQILCVLADFHTRSRQYAKAQDYARRALTLRPLFGQAYFELAEVAYRLERWDECAHLVRIGLGSKCPKDILPVDPSEYELRPLVMLEYALFQMGDPQSALHIVEELIKKYPKNTHLIDRQKAILGFIARLELEKSSLNLMKWLEHNEQSKIRPLLEALPRELQDHPTFIRLANAYQTVDGQKNRLVIYCGPTFEEWNPTDALTKGIGGSEEAVIYLSRELLRLGWSITVYNNCDRPSVYDGIEYKNFWTHDPAQPADIFIAWRNSEYLMQANKDSRAFLWMHDRQKMEYWTPERIAKVELIFALSKYHREDLPEIPDSKFLITRNGIVPSQFAGVSQVHRDHLKCIYASSPDRGLDILLSIWPDIKKAVPDAHLHVFYGFSKTYDMLHKDHQNMLEFKERVLELLKQDGVHYHGRVNHAELHDHMMSSGLWLYPTNFTEISCITAMKAQVAGAIPITMALAALDETVQHGYKIAFGIQDTRSQRAFTNITIDLLKNPEKQERIRTVMMPWALAHFSWESVAQQWNEVFKNGREQAGAYTAYVGEVSTPPISS